LPTQIFRGLRIVALTAADAEPLIAKIIGALPLIAEAIGPTGLPLPSPLQLLMGAS
jgi:hypothetical protein